jgi:hypothetical protein
MTGIADDLKDKIINNHTHPRYQRSIVFKNIPVNNKGKNLKQYCYINFPLNYG